jgi:hypothetical protein
MKQINLLGNILDTSQRPGKDPTRSVSGTLSGNILTLKYLTVVHYAEERAIRDQVRYLAEESVQILADKMSSIKSSFKEATGHALKLSEIDSADDLELIQATAHSPRKIAYYRRNVQLEIQN